jgi:hypothetical protein
VAELVALGLTNREIADRLYLSERSHYVEVFKLLDGGLRDGGWMGEGRPKGSHEVAILPGLTHYNIFSSPLLAAAILAFLKA